MRTHASSCLQPAALDSAVSSPGRSKSRHLPVVIVVRFGVPYDLSVRDSIAGWGIRHAEAPVRRTEVADLAHRLVVPLSDERVRQMRLPEM